jgi:hypothetical protein
METHAKQKTALREGKGSRSEDSGVSCSVHCITPLLFRHWTRRGGITSGKRARGTFVSLIAGLCSTCKIGDCKPTVYESTSTWGPSLWCCIHSVGCESYGEENGIKNRIWSWWAEILNYTCILPKHVHMNHFNTSCFFCQLNLMVMNARNIN